MPTGSAHPQVILIAEDDVVIGLDLEAVLRDEGYGTVGPCLSVSEALDALERERVDAAILDFDLADGDSRPVARRLREKGVPFVFCSGRPERIDDEFQDCAKLAKPCQASDIRKTLGGFFSRE